MVIEYWYNKQEAPWVRRALRSEDIRIRFRENLLKRWSDLCSWLLTRYNERWDKLGATVTANLAHSVQVGP